LFITTLSVGCVPATHYDLPSIRGRLVDATLHPVDGARVHIFQTVGRGSRDITVFTDSAGRFSRHADSWFYIQSVLPVELNWAVVCDVTATDGIHVIQLGRIYSTFYNWFEKPHATDIDFGTVVLK
jgi:hypothetical protein